MKTGQKFNTRSHNIVQNFFLLNYKAAKRTTAVWQAVKSEFRGFNATGIFYDTAEALTKSMFCSQSL
jgi:hypothetical protein